MFIVEYRTKSHLYAGVHPSCFLTLGSHKATSREEAEKYAQGKLGENVEILSVNYSQH